MLVFQFERVRALANASHPRRDAPLRLTQLWQRHREVPEEPFVVASPVRIATIEATGRRSSSLGPPCLASELGRVGRQYGMAVLLSSIGIRPLRLWRSGTDSSWTKRVPRLARRWRQQRRIHESPLVSRHRPRTGLKLRDDGTDVLPDCRCGLRCRVVSRTTDAPMGPRPHCSRVHACRVVLAVGARVCGRFQTSPRVAIETRTALL